MPAFIGFFYSMALYQTDHPSSQRILTQFGITEEQQPKVLPTIVIKAQDKATGDTQKL